MYFKYPQSRQISSRISGKAGGLIMGYAEAHTIKTIDEESEYPFKEAGMRENYSSALVEERG
jgi:hypothetical protein